MIAKQSQLQSIAGSCDVAAACNSYDGLTNWPNVMQARMRYPCPQHMRLHLHPGGLLAAISGEVALMTPALWASKDHCSD